MSTTKDDGGPAFPEPTRLEDNRFTIGHKITTVGGMKLRDWFAGLAIAEQFKFAISKDEHCAVARRCYDIADAMIEARNK